MSSRAAKRQKNKGWHENSLRASASFIIACCACLSKRDNADRARVASNCIIPSDNLEASEGVSEVLKVQSTLWPVNLLRVLSCTQSRLRNHRCHRIVHERLSCLDSSSSDLLSATWAATKKTLEGLDACENKQLIPSP